MSQLACFAIREDIRGELKDILPYTEIQNHIDYWKIEVNDEQVIAANEIRKTHKIILKYEYLKTLDPYFEVKDTPGKFSLSDRGLDILADEFIEKVEIEKEVTE